MNTDLIDIKIRAVEGGVTAAAGFKAAGIHAGFRKNPERLDYALVVPDKDVYKRQRLDRADGTLTGRDRMRLFGSAVSLHAPIRSCGGLGSSRPARDMSGNEGSPVGASGMWGHRAVRI